MGYRSDVGLAVKEDLLQEALCLLTDEKGIDMREIINDRLFKLADVHEVLDGWALYVWEGWKWYTDVEEYSEVVWLDKVLREWMEQDKGDQFTFVRIGEEDDDVDEWGNRNDPFDLYYERKLSYS